MHVCRLKVMYVCMYACTGEGGGGGGGGGGGEGGVMGALYITTLNRTRLSYGLGELLCVDDGKSS